MMPRKISKLLSLAALSRLPLTRLFPLKRKLLSYAGVGVSPGVRVVSSARFINGGKISIGENTWVGHEVMFVGGRATISIGADVDIAPRVTFVTGSHRILEGQHKVAGEGYSQHIVIGDG